MSYKYKNPLKNGYTKVNKAEYKKIIKNYKWYRKYEVYENNTLYMIHQFEPVWVIFLCIMTIPLCFLMEGLSGLLEAVSGIYDIMFSKKTGNFISEIVYKDEVTQRNYKSLLNKLK